MEKHYIENLKSLRKSKGISQKEFGEKLGIAHSNYNTIENGSAEITVSRLYKIAEILDVSVFQILFEIDKELMEKKVEEEIEVIKKSLAYEKIRNEVRKEVENEYSEGFKQIGASIQTLFKKMATPETPEKKAEREKENSNNPKKFKAFD